jgi:hypothetical protein
VGHNAARILSFIACLNKELSIPSPTANSLNQRATALQHWFRELLPALQGGTLQGDLLPVSGDASFRRYFRGVTERGTWILVDAPPATENSKPFVEVARRLAACGVQVPEVLAADLAQGFMCLSDFGDVLYWSKLAQAQASPSVRPTADTLYHAAFAELLKIQACPAGGLPAFDEEKLLREMRLFTEWFCGGLMQHVLSAAEHALLERTYAFFVSAMLAQPRVFVHRDYHSRNLMYREGLPPGVLDFQDAVAGPVTYDLVSLLKDCYIEWPRTQVNAWALAYAAQAQEKGILAKVVPEQFLRDFDLAGAQRHIKVAGIFSRLWLRDGKAAYLRDIPLVMRYLVTVSDEQPALADFSTWLHERILPRLDAALAKATRASDGARR